MTMLDHALALAAKGFHVFPLRPGSKLPAIKGYPEKATRDPEQIKAWWAKWPEANVGISTSRFGDDEALLVVDVDNKNGKNGDGEIFRLELEGHEFPPTYTQRTPTGGRHLVYRCPEPVKQGVDVLGRGLDVRSKGGFIVGVGSRVDAGCYAGSGAAVEPAPQWLVDRCGAAPERNDSALAPESVNIDRAVQRAIEYLEHEAPLAVEGDGGDDTTYRVACRIKDFGVGPGTCLELMEDHWNAACQPPWSHEELAEKVEHAYRYGQEPVGAAAPEAHFEPVQKESATNLSEESLHPFEKLNREFAFVLAGGGHHILWETKDADGKFKLEHLTETAFHRKHASWMLPMGDGKTKPVTELWMKADNRRGYDGICFRPGRKAPKGFYNLWRGFAVEPLAPGEQPTKDMKDALDAFLEHARENVCRGDATLYRWLIGYFAHLVQKPSEKPLVALVFRGGKGVGKNALVDRVGALLGNHYLLTSNRRYLVGNFNSHLEYRLLFALDEAFWSGDKQAEGQLKDLITGSHHVIEHKGKEPYSVENCTRIVIIGNEEWLVPSSHDERRFAVFHVGDGRKQDRAFFQAMREGMERGGYRLLLRYLLDYDLSGIDVNEAPSTDALMDQKLATLEPFHQWWLDCLTEGRLVGSDFGGEWPAEIDRERFRAAFDRHSRQRNIKGRQPDSRQVGKMLKACLPSIGTRRSGDREAGQPWLYVLPPLERCRKEWEAFIGHEVSWE